MTTYIGYIALIAMIVVMTPLGILMVWRPHLYRKYLMGEPSEAHLFQWEIRFIQSDRFLTRLRITGVACLVFAVLAIGVLIWGKPAEPLHQDALDGESNGQPTRTSP